ncbi:MAG: hypothetical protein IJ470_03660 [Clostridia bacterium]|nr:hypothetical protein [Clostridia bacterium]
MTGTEMMNRALILLGYTDSQGSVSAEQRFKSRAVTVINTVYADLYFTGKQREELKPIKSLSDEIRLSERALNDVMPYGVAAYFAMSESDGDQQQIFARLYNQKRTASETANKIVDVIPYPEG